MNVYKLDANANSHVLVDEAGLVLLSKEKRWVFLNGYLCHPTRHHLNPGKGFHRRLMNAPDSLHIDHINGDRFDNRICNLRLCTHAENMRNRKQNCNNKSGEKGVYLNNGKWRAEAKFKGKRFSLGSFFSKEDAVEARKKFEKSINDEFLTPQVPPEIKDCHVIYLGNLKDWLVKNYQMPSE